MYLFASVLFSLSIRHVLKEVGMFDCQPFPKSSSLSSNVSEKIICSTNKEKLISV